MQNGDLKVAVFYGDEHETCGEGACSRSAAKPS
jgi:hypothetical protein